MRKLIWCCSAAGLLATGGFLSLAYYASCCPGSVVGRSMHVLAEASVAMQPLSGLTSLAVRASRANAPARDSAGSIEESIPDDPQPVAPDEEALPARSREEYQEHRTNKIEPDAAPIVIGEEDPMPREEITEVIHPGDGLDMKAKEVPSKSYPVFMPYCPDEDDEPAPPKMPRAEAGDDDKTSDSHARMEDSDFKEWMELFEENKANKTATVEELPAPKELEPNHEPKCQEDLHRHEHYSGCPRTTCPYCPTKKKGGEESSEEPRHPAQKPKPSKNGKCKEQCPRTQGVDTMEYRKSDAGLGEYGPGPLH